MIVRWLVLLCLFIPSQLVDVGTPQEDWEDLYCKSSLVAHEALNQSVEGKRAVLDVIVYRMQKTGQSCAFVALQPKQFSNFTQRKLEDGKKFLHEYQKAATLEPVCEKCEYFYSGKAPWWASKMQKVKTIGKHTFMKIKEE